MGDGRGSGEVIQRVEEELQVVSRVARCAVTVGRGAMAGGMVGSRRDATDETKRSRQKSLGKSSRTMEPASESTAPLAVAIMLKRSLS